MARRSLKPASLSNAEARRIALNAQGFKNQSKHNQAGWAKLAKAVDGLHLLQIDSVNVLVRSHYLPLFARLGSYDMALLDQRCFDNKKRHFFEAWAHEASLIPLKLHPLARWRMDRAREGNGTYVNMDKFGREEKTFLRETLAFVTKNGPTRASEVPGGGKSAGAWWGWSKGKLAMETLFDQGLLTTATRNRFERIYDIPERVIPSETLNLPTPPEKAAFRALIGLGAQALGVATEKDLRDYFRLGVNDARQAIQECAEEGIIEPCKIEGMSQAAYLHRNAQAGKPHTGTALLSPFDPLIWHRARAEMLFDFTYRLELYTPEAKRKFGYYVLPILHGENLVGRLCLKADRASSTLRVNAAHLENVHAADEVQHAVAQELLEMAKWLSLNGVSVASKGNFAKMLKNQIKALI